MEKPIDRISRIVQKDKKSIPRVVFLKVRMYHDRPIPEIKGAVKNTRFQLLFESTIT